MWYLQIAALLHKLLTFSLVHVDALVTDCFTVVGEKARTECSCINEHEPGIIEVGGRCEGSG